MKKNMFYEWFIRFIHGLVPYVVVVILVLIFKNYVVSPIKVNGDSMYPTLENKDLMILDSVTKRFEKIERKEIVVIKIKNEYIIKRVIGLPGEKIEYKNHKFYVNDVQMDDEFAEFTENFSTVVPDGKYFVLGDNRKNSMDSRFFGAFSADEIKGTAVFIFFPFNRFGSPM